MQKIGFNDQPYLVFEHFDAAHPHVHVLTTNIQKDGKRISLHNLGKNQSNQARKEIENTYHLIKAGGQRKNQEEKVQPIDVQKITYGKSTTKIAITTVLDAVVTKYKYTSLGDLNAILRLYNVVADTGGKNSWIRQNNGLVYRVLDEKGNKVGVPIKASSIYNRPTLNFLKQKFEENKALKEPHQRRLKSMIDWILLTPYKSLRSLQNALEQERISLVICQNEHGIIYGLTYIDHQNKCVFNSSEIGEQYNANAITKKCSCSPTSEKHSETIAPTNCQEMKSSETETELSQPATQFLRAYFACRTIH